MSEVLTDTFRGDDAKLVGCIEALLKLDRDGALVPNGLGGPNSHAWAMLAAAACRLRASAPETFNPEADIAKMLQDPAVVHLNMLRGGIAKPSWANIKHLYPEQFAENANSTPTPSTASSDVAVIREDVGFPHELSQLAATANALAAQAGDTEHPNFVLVMKDTLHQMESALRRSRAALATPTPSDASPDVHAALRWAMDEIDVLANKLCGFAYPQAMIMGVDRKSEQDNYVKAVMARRSDAMTVDAEELAIWLHNETDHPEHCPGYTWPQNEHDDGRREGGFVKIVPKYAQEYFRDIARRMIAGPLSRQERLTHD